MGCAELPRPNNNKNNRGNMAGNKKKEVLDRLFKDFRALRGFSVRLGKKNKLPNEILDEILQYKIMEFIASLDNASSHGVVENFLQMLKFTDKQETLDLIKGVEQKKEK